MNNKKIRILIADDSKLISRLLAAMFDKTADFEVLGIAENGEEAVEMAKELNPDLITMDIMMPKMDGYEATKRIMSEHPTPIIILSSLIHEEEVDTACQALSVGALEARPKFFDLSGEALEFKEKYFLNMVRALSEVRVVRRREPIAMSIFKETNALLSSDRNEILALGLSTGGPEALTHLASSLKASFPVPIVVVLHISKGFLGGLIKCLQKVSALDVRIASHGEALLPGKMYFAPDDYHLLIKKDKQPIAILDEGKDNEIFKPSVNQLLHSLAKSYPGAAMGGVLTGMGKDGAEGLLAMKQAGCNTFAQTSSSSVVGGMPDAAREKQAVMNSVSLQEMPDFIERIMQKNRGES